jgi:hypothetical protein
MRQRREHDHWEDDDWDAERQTKALAGFAFLLVLAILGVYLIFHLRVMGKVEDCLLAQRTNCDALLH